MARYHSNPNVAIPNVSSRTMKMLESFEQDKGEGAPRDDTITSVNQGTFSPEPRDAPLESTPVEVRQDAPSETLMYTIYASDINNKAQVNDTRSWLEGLVKGKSKLHEELGFSGRHLKISRRTRQVFNMTDTYEIH
jgi:hypothetical protein